MKMIDIEPNNIEQALTYYKYCLGKGTWSSDKAESLFGMQDDPDKLINAVAAERDRFGAVRTDADPDAISDSDLKAISDLDADLFWDLETEQDGTTDEYDDGTRLDSDEFRIDRLAGNPYHARDGKFAPGPHASSGFAGGATPWNRAFDNRSHLKQIEEHRAAETLHRAASLKLKGQMDALKQRAATASPVQRAPMQRRFDKLATAREQHRSAAEGAKTARKQATEDMEHARAAHVAGRHQEAAMRRETATQRALAQREAVSVIGQRMGVAPAAREHAAGAVSPGHPSWQPTEADTHAEARNRAAGELPTAAHVVALPHAQALNRAQGFLRGLLGR